MEVSVQITRNATLHTAQKLKFSIKNFFSKCDQTCSFLRIWSHLMETSLMENFSFCAVSWVRSCAYTQSKVQFRGGSRTAATSKVELFVIIVKRLEAVNYYHKELHLGCCSSPRSASAVRFI